MTFAQLAGGPQHPYSLTRSSILRTALALKLTTDTLAQHLAQQLLPAYLLSGDEPLLIAEAADAVRARARALGFTERETYFIEREADWEEVGAAAGNLSLFAARRIIEIRLASAKPGVAGAAALGKLAQTAAEDLLLLVITPRLDRDAQGASWVKAMETAGAWMQIWPVDEQRLLKWLRGGAAPRP